MKSHTPKATPHVTQNESLIFERSQTGRRGLQEVATQCAQKAAYAARQIGALEGFSLPHSAPRFNEFVVRAPVAASGLLERLASGHGVTGGLALSRYMPGRANDLLVCVTETNTRAEIDALVEGLRESARR